MRDGLSRKNKEQKMKKTLILLGAFVLAIVSQAATVDWKVTGTVSELSYSVYLMAGTTAITSWESLAVIEAAALDSGSIVKAGRNYAADGTTTHANITKDGSFYYVVVSADKNSYAVSGLYAGSEYVYDTTLSPPETAPAGVPAFAANTASYSTFAVPEPTSGLLLLLGMAGLALKRKVA